MAKLLVIDDEPNVLYSLRASLQSDELDVVTADSGHAGISAVERERPNVVVLDVRLPDMSGLDVYEKIRVLDPRLPVIFVTAYSTTDTAIEAMRRGAFDYLLKPFDLHQLRAAIEQALEVSRLSHVPAVVDELSPAVTEGDHIVGESPVMQDVYKLIGRVAPQDVTVLIQGESGTGKELVARAIYHYSRRSHMPFLAINCAAIPENLLESELFGHERGAFTGAERRRIGKFEQLDGGTIFLDEIGDMSPATQSKMLRVLQEQRFERVGSNETITTNVRVITATNHNLEQLVATGQFRSDLYYRLNVFTIRLPALSERKNDLPVLMNHFLRHMNVELGKNVRHFTDEAMQCLREYRWPGNVRELQSAIKYSMVRASGDVVTIDCLPETLRAGRISPPNAPESTTAIAPSENTVVLLTRELLQRGETDIYRTVHNEVDRILLDELLANVGGNQLEAAALLGISRTTLRMKLRSLGLSIEKQLMPESDQAGQ
jgi:nitrogen regulation protein NR(I)